MSITGARRPSYLGEQKESAKRTGPYRFVRDLIREYRDDDMGGAAAELAFRFAIAVFPFTLFLLTIGAFIAHINGGEDPSQRVIDLFGDSLPGDVASVIRTQTEHVVRNDSPTLLGIGLAGTLWAATNGTLAIMKATNRIYDVEETRSIPRRIGLALLITLLAGGAIIATLAASLVTEVLKDDVAGLFGIGTNLSWIVSIVRVPLNLVIVVAAASLVFWLAPNRSRPFRLVTPGALVFAIGWAVATWLFALYVANWANYDAIYGALGAALILLIWLQITSTLLLLGAELNSIVDPDVQTDGETA